MDRRTFNEEKEAEERVLGMDGLQNILKYFTDS